MKQKVFIIFGIIFLIALIALWVYLFFFYGKDEAPRFTDLGPEGSLDGGVIIPPTPLEPVVATTTAARPRLRQLTTKPVIGFMEAGSATTSLSVTFAEAGTGHIFSVDTLSGSEVRLSNTTVAEANFASFSPSGQIVALRSKNDRRTSPITIGRLNPGESNLTTVEIDKQVLDFAVINEGELMYSHKTSEGIENRVYALTNSSDRPLFTVPFYETAMRWGTTSSSTHYVYPKPSYLLEGYVYSYRGSVMNREPIQGFGLSALISVAHVSYSSMSNFETESFIYNRLTGTTERSSLVIIPEKCTPGLSINTLWCGSEITDLPIEFPDSWYRGQLAFSDTIWELDLETGSAIALVDTLAASGREIDIINMSKGQSGTALYFINKNDNTLWMYEL